MKGFGLSPAGAYPTAGPPTRPAAGVHRPGLASTPTPSGALDVSFDAASQVATCSGKPQVLVGAG